MPTNRNYELITEIESGTPPAISPMVVGDAIAVTDALSIQGMAGLGLAANGVVASVADLTELKAIPLVELESFSSGSLILKRDTIQIYKYEPTSSAVANDLTVVTPTNKTGSRFIQTKSYPYSEITTERAIVDEDEILFVNCSSGTQTFDLPIAADNKGRSLWFKKTDTTTNALVIDPFSGQLVDGSGTISLTMPRQAVRVYCNGSTWFVIESYYEKTHFESTAQHGATGAVMGTTNVQDVTNKNLDDTTTTFEKTGTTDRRFRLICNTSVDSTTRDIQIPDASTTMVGTDTTQDISNKRLLAPSISTPTFKNTALSADTGSVNDNGQWVIGGTTTTNYHVIQNSNGKLYVGTISGSNFAASIAGSGTAGSYLAIADDTVANRWDVGSDNADTELKFRIGNANHGTGAQVAGLTTGGVYKIDTINEMSSNNGVLVDGNLLKDDEVSTTALKAKTTGGQTFKTSAGTTIGSISNAGAWTLGDLAGSERHVFAPNIQVGGNALWGSSTNIFQYASRELLSTLAGSGSVPSGFTGVTILAGAAPGCGSYIMTMYFPHNGGYYVRSSFMINIGYDGNRFLHSIVGGSFLSATGPTFDSPYWYWTIGGSTTGITYKLTMNNIDSSMKIARITAGTDNQGLIIGAMIFSMGL